MHSALKSPLFLLYVGLIYFPSGLLYIGESDFFFEKLTALVLFICSIIAFVRKGLGNEVVILLVVFLSFMMLPLILNISDLTAAESGIIDSLGQFIRIFIYVGVAHYINCIVNNNRKNYLENLTISFVRATVYGQMLLFIARILNLGQLIDYLFISKSIIFSNGGILILKFDGSLGNPNYLGYILCLTLFVIFSLRNLLSRWEYIILLIFTIGMVLVSGSRTSFVVLVAELALFFPIRFVYLIIFLYPFIEIIALVNDRLFELYQAIITSGNVESFEERRELVDQSIAYFSQRPFFGFGYRPIEMTDNFYVTHLMRYGFIGSVAHIAILLVLIYRHSPSFRFMFMFLVPVLLFNYTGAFVDNFRLYFATSLLFILCANINGSIFSSRVSNWRLYKYFPRAVNS